MQTKAEQQAHPTGKHLDDPCRITKQVEEPRLQLKTLQQQILDGILNSNTRLAAGQTWDFLYISQLQNNLSALITWPAGPINSVCKH